MRIPAGFITALGMVALTAPLWSQVRGNPNDWPTAGYDAQRTSWLRDDVNISVESMSKPGFRLQWTSKLDVAGRPGETFAPGIVTPGVNIFTPISAIAAPGNSMFAVDNDTGNVFWTRRFEGTLPARTAACPGGISGAPTRVVNLVVPPAAPARGGGARGARSYYSAVGQPGEGVPLPAVGGGRAGGAPAGAAGGRGANTAPAPAPAPNAPATGGQRGRGQAPLPASPFPTNDAAQGRGGIWAPSGTVYAITADGQFRRIGLVSGKDVQRPARFLPPGARFSDLIAVGDMAYTSTSGSCGGAANGIWAINVSGDPTSAVAWKTNGGDPIGSLAFTTDGTVIAAIGPGTIAAGGFANAVVALDPKTLAIKDWFTRPGVVFAAAPVLFREGGKDVLAVTTKDGRILLLDAASLGGSDHATPLYASRVLTSGGATFASHGPALWQERTTAPSGSDTGGAVTAATGGTRWLLAPVNGRLAPQVGATSNGPITGGAILAVKVSEVGGWSIEPGWISENLNAPLTPVIVNGVGFALAGAQAQPARLVALHAMNGKTLWQSERDIKGPVSGRSFWAGSGHIFVGTPDGTVHAFGFDMERGTPSQRR